MNTQQQLLLVYGDVMPECAYRTELETLLETLGLPFCVCSDEQLAGWLAETPAAEPAPAVVLFAPTVSDVLLLARSARRHWDGAEFLFVQPRQLMDDFRRSLGLAPMLGSYWAVEELSAATLGPRILQAASDSQRRERFRTTLARANSSLAGRAGAGNIQRHNIADYYLANYIDFAQDAIVGVDTQYRILFWSAGAEELFGVEKKVAIEADVRTMPFWDNSLGRAAESMAVHNRSVVVEQHCQVGDRALALEVLCSGVRDAEGMVLGVSLIIRDVSAVAAKRAVSEALLQAEHQRLSQLFHQAPGFVAVTQGPRHLMELANRAFYQLVGRQDLIGRPAAEAFPQMEGQTLVDLLNRVYSTRRPFVGRGMPVYIKRSPDAQPDLRYVDFVFQPVLSEQGLPTGVFCQGNDVTAQKLMQEQLQRSEEHLEALVEERTRELERSQLALHQSQKLEAVGKLTGGVAHDFNNVLQIIGANLQLIRDAVRGEERLARRLDAALAAVDRGAKLSSQLLAFARRQPLSPAPTNLARHLRSMDEILRRALGEEIEIETVVAGGLWTTLIDPHQLENVILNLAINARDAMRDGGKLTLELSNAMLDEEYVRMVSDVAPGQYVLLAVSDTGAGMSAETVEHAFEPFFTTKPEGQGTGLGLSMAYGFAKQSHGHIRLYSEPGSGTTVKLYLPRSFQEEVEPVPRLMGEVEGGDETILVVEDDPAVQAAVVDQLTGLGYKVLRANDAQSALSILQSGLHIDMLFTDVVMPGSLRSPELARQAQELLPEIVVLFTSGYTQNAIVHGGRLDPGVELISKPYRREDLARRIRHLLANQAQKRALATRMAEARPVQIAPMLDILLVEDQLDLLEMCTEMVEMLGHSVAGVDTAEKALAALAERRFDVLMTDVGLPGISGVELAGLVLEQYPEVKILFVSGYGQPDTALPSRALAKPFSIDELERILAEM